jgi:nickel-dependent lactate racemase
MHVLIDYGLEQAAFEVADAKLLAMPGPLASSVTEPAASVHAALNAPVGFPALRQALTADDHVAILIDDALPHLVEMLVPTLEHVLSAGVSAGAVTLLSPSNVSSQAWLNDLPEALEEVVLEVHCPTDRKKLSYLATTKKNRRVYLNRTAVDADQLVVLSGRRYDPQLGHGGGEGAIFPAFSDENTRKELGKLLHLSAPGVKPWPVRAEAIEVAWLLGAPFLIQAIEGAGDGIHAVVAGSFEAGIEGQRLQDACWRRTVPQPADVVVASLSGNPNGHSFSDLAAAVICASRVVRPDGRIIVLSQAKPTLGPGTDMLLQAEGPGQALQELQKRADVDLAPALQWAHAASHARINLLSGLPAETAESLHTTPLDHPGQVQRLIDAASSCLFLPDAHKSLAVIA